jgi:hypothetical protein
MNIVKHVSRDENSLIANIRYGGWIQTYSGIAFYPMDPREEEILIEDIAHSLSLLCRFAGHSERFYSIAEHCVHIADWIDDEHKLTALLHDASEAYLVDIPKPVKMHLPDYVKIEKHLEEVISNKFGMQFPFHPMVKEGDNRILITERDTLLKTPAKAWDFEPEPLNVEIQCWSPEVAEQKFLEAYYNYKGNK